LITRPRAQARGLARRLAELGAEVITFPAIAIRPPADWSPLDADLDNLKEYDWLIFTSANGVRYFCQRLLERHRDIRSLAAIKIAAIGPATAAALEARGLLPDWQPGEYVAEAMAAGLGPKLKGKRVLLPRADIARPFLATDLQRQGAKVKEVAVYRTVKSAGNTDAVRELLATRRITAVTFTSSSTVRAFLELLGEQAVALMQGVDVFCIGPVTAATAREAGLAVTATAAEYTETGLVEAIL
ncbi:MAG: uroporphyrinogen-III synthase, partial [Moorella sp. (in: Bacteria)]|nr:uroporphyrinogen-III synthase [Moorella sp. (in: firmicutes)]